MHLIGQYIWTTKKLSNIYANYLNYRNIVGGIIDFDVNGDAVEFEMARPAVPATQKEWLAGQFEVQKK